MPDTDPRALLALDVNEVSVVDAGAVEVKFLLTKRLGDVQETPMTTKPPEFKIITDVQKDMDAVKQLSGSLAIERLSTATMMIETLKSQFAEFTDVYQLWDAVDDIHGMLWPVENEIYTAVFKSANGELLITDVQREAITKALGEVAAPVITIEAFTADIETLKAKSITPARLAELTALSEGLAGAIAEMSPAAVVEAVVEDLEVEKSAQELIDAAVAPLVAQMAELTKALAPPVEDAATTVETVTKAAHDSALEELTKAKDAAETATAELQKQLDELAAAPAAPVDEDEIASTQVTKSLWTNVVSPS